MNDNKKVLTYCPNFYKIIEFKPIEGDEITKSIIKMYKEYIFKVDININENIIEIGKLDEAVSKYIDDYIFISSISLRSSLPFFNNNAIL